MADEPKTVDHQIYLELRQLNITLARIADYLKEVVSKVGKV